MASHDKSERETRPMTAPMTLTPVSAGGQSKHIYANDPVAKTVAAVATQLRALAIAENNRTLKNRDEWMPVGTSPWWEARGLSSYVLIPRYGSIPLFVGPEGQPHGFEIARSADAFEAIRKTLAEFGRRVEAGEWQAEIEEAQRRVSRNLKGKTGRSAAARL